MTEVISVRFRSGCKIYYFSPGQLHIEAGQDVIVETAQGAEYVTCTEGNHPVEDHQVVEPLRRVLRLATENDRRSLQLAREREKDAFAVCQKKIAQHGLEMKLVRVECSFDSNKILFFFTADGRVDFRELVKDLAAAFHARIELRQIGVRDEAKMLGGLGICGRPFCCNQFMDDFIPVSIKMAKTQNLSLNPAKISGTCGRLMCCLKYEQDTYEALIRTSPKPESFVDTPDGRGTVMEADILRQRVKVRMEKDPDTVNTYENEDVAVLRSGKAKKNDSPIPADLAPISGGGKRPGFEGGQMPLVRQLPKRGFKNIFAKEYATVNVSELEVFENGTEVTSAMLVEKKIIRKELDGLKVLGNGELTKKLTVKAVKFTGSAKEKIEAVGGTAEVI